MYVIAYDQFDAALHGRRPAPVVSRAEVLGPILLVKPPNVFHEFIPGAAKFRQERLPVR